MKDDQSKYGDRLCQHDLDESEVKLETCKLEIHTCSYDDNDLDITSL